MRNKLLGVVLATIMILSVTVVPVSAETINGTNITTSRLAGQDHYQTSVAIAGAYNNNGECGNVILASGNSFPDALSGSLLSKKLNAPILLVNTTVNGSSDAFTYMSAHVSNTGTVYIVGGTGVIGLDFETKLTLMGYSNIKRLGGTDRYDTNMFIVNDVNVLQGTSVFIASGENFPDALSISSFSGSKQYPTLLVGENYLPEKTNDYLLNEKPSNVYIAGGISVVSQDLENQIKSLVPNATITRLAGDDRFGTNAAVLNEFSRAPDTVYIASGDDFQDVLAGSALAAKTGNPIILADNQLSTLPPAVETYLKKISSSGVEPNLIALGGTVVVSDILCQQVENYFSSSINTDTSATKENSQKIVYSRIVGSDTNATYYLDSGGHVWAWGSGTYGQLGIGPALEIQPTPVEVRNIYNIVSIAGNGYNGYALDSSGDVWAWGGGLTGQLGNGTTNNSSVPVQVSNLKKIVSIAAGGSGNGYALDNSGHIWDWGAGSGLGSETGADIQSTPIQVATLTNIVAISAGNGIACALDSYGHVWTWGLGVPGSSNPVQITNLSNIIEIAAGASTDYALDNSGHVWVAADGIGNRPLNDTTTGIPNTPVQVANLSNIKAISNGFLIFYALDKSGNVWTCPRNTLIAATQVSNLTNIVSIAGGMDTGYALDSFNRVWAWGWGYYGALGIGTTSDSINPVQVLGLPK